VQGTCVENEAQTITCSFELPGIDPSDIEKMISVQDGVISINKKLSHKAPDGNDVSTSDLKQQGGTITLNERETGTLYINELKNLVKNNSACSNIQYTNGIVTFTVSKSE